VDLSIGPEEETVALFERAQDTPRAPQNQGSSLQGIQVTISELGAAIC
jgi:hypothetical protein